MQEDRELLELAAKAAGIKGNYVEDDDWYGTGILFTDEDDCNKIINPLIDDGDALRLVVKLRLQFIQMDMEIESDGVTKKTPVLYVDTIEGRIYQYLDEDQYAATRLAIVRAAAEIGKAMK